MLTFFDHDSPLSPPRLPQGRPPRPRRPDAARAARGPGPGRQVPLIRDKSVIFLFLHGGPSQFETFDPKMTAPEGIRSATGEVATRIPGVTFGGSFPRLAALADRLTIVRSFVPGDANHDIKPIVGRDTFGANLGSRLLPRRRRRTTRTPACPPTSSSSRAPSTRRRRPAIDDLRPIRRHRAALARPDAPFDPSRRRRRGPTTCSWRSRATGSTTAAACSAGSTGLARRLDRGPRDRGRRPACASRRYRLLTGGLGRGVRPGAAKTPASSPATTPPRWSGPTPSAGRWNNYNNYVDNAKSLGKLLLLARRLCERGCGFVTVTTNFVWDMHADVNNAPMAEGMRYMGRPLDHALSAFIEDLARPRPRATRSCSSPAARWAGRRGSTARAAATTGATSAPLLLSGGGLPMGQVIGRSNRDGAAPQSEPITHPEPDRHDPAHALRRRRASTANGDAARDPTDHRGIRTYRGADGVRSRHLSIRDSRRLLPIKTDRRTNLDRRSRTGPRSRPSAHRISAAATRRRASRRRCR